MKCWIDAKWVCRRPRFYAALGIGAFAVAAGFGAGDARGEPSPGDVNGNGQVAVSDLDLLRGHILGRAPLTNEALIRADANQDGTADIADVLWMNRYLYLTFTLPNGTPLTMVRMPHGSFQMGSPQSEADPAVGWAYTDELPQHQVTIANDYYMSRVEVTQRQWVAVMGNWPGSTPNSSYGAGNDFPAYNVSWNDIQDFETAINALGLGGRFRLPSEAEWEYAARGGSQTRFQFGDSGCTYNTCADCELSNYAWWCGNNRGNPGERGWGSKVVGGKIWNAFGLNDTSGNVWEWCEDWYHANYTSAPTDGLPWLTPATSVRIIRGGSWDYTSRYCRPANRFYASPANRSYFIGFRLTWTQTQ